MIYEKFGQKRTDSPRQDLVASMKSRIENEEQKVEDKDKLKPLWEIYFYLFYGLYTSAWKKINKLTEENRWRIPGDVYHFLEDLENKPVQCKSQ